MTSKKLPPISHIGSYIRIIKTKNPSLLRFEGKVIDETKSTLIVESREKVKRLLKNQISIKIIK